MGGGAIGRRGVEGEAKETTVFPLKEDERRPSWSFVSEINERRGEESSNFSTPRRRDLRKNNEGQGALKFEK
jgi:hypothetical protein